MSEKGTKEPIYEFSASDGATPIAAITADPGQELTVATTRLLSTNLTLP